MRNFFHIFIGFSIVYAIGILTGFQTYTLEAKIIGVPLVSVLIGVVIGFFWEVKQAWKKPKNFDRKDIIRTAIGTLAGGLLSLFVVSQSLMFCLLVISAILIVREFKK